MKALLIHHGKAGGGKLSRSKAVELVERAGWKVEVMPRDKVNAKALAAAEPDVIVVAGGDGSIAKIARLVPDRGVPLAFLPTGTANNIGRSLGMGTDPPCVAAAWDIDRRSRLDLGRVHHKGSDRLFVEAVGFGVFAQSLSQSSRRDGKAKIEFGRAALRQALRAAQPVKFHISVDGKERRLQALLVEVMNVPITGPWLRLCPEGDPGDGVLDLAYLPPGASKKMQAWLEGVSQSAPPLRWLRGHRIEIETSGCAMRIDDEVCALDKGSRVSITLESEPLQVLGSTAARALDAPDGSDS